MHEKVEITIKQCMKKLKLLLNNAWKSYHDVKGQLSALKAVNLTTQQQTKSP
jgi:hypothetical protein